jgi:hypothetical protein
VSFYLDTGQTRLERCSPYWSTQSSTAFLVPWNPEFLYLFQIAFLQMLKSELETKNNNVSQSKKQQGR